MSHEKKFFFFFFFKICFQVFFFNNKKILSKFFSLFVGVFSFFDERFEVSMTV